MSEEGKGSAGSVSARPGVPSNESPSSIINVGTAQEEQTQKGISSHVQTERKPTIGFDLESLKLSQNFSDMVSGKKNIHEIKVGRPDKNAYFRIRSDPGWSIDTAVIVEKKEMKTTTYVVAPSLWEALVDDITPQRLFTSINTQGVVSLVPATLSKPNGEPNSWNESRLAVVEDAKLHWVKMISNTAAGAYETFVALGNLPEPKWPDLTFQELFNIAFKDHYIDSLDHPVLQRRRGEIL